MSNVAQNTNRAPASKHGSGLQEHLGDNTPLEEIIRKQACEKGLQGMLEVTKEIIGPRKIQEGLANERQRE